MPFNKGEKGERGRVGEGEVGRERERICKYIHLYHHIKHSLLVIMTVLSNSYYATNSTKAQF